MKALKIIMAIFLLLILGLASALGAFFYSLNQPVTHECAQEIINIANGASTEEIVKVLHEKGILSDPLVFKLYLKLTKSAPKIKAGDYLFPSPISATEVLTDLQTGGLIPDKFTIIEGWTRWDIARALAQTPSFKLKNADEALRLMNDTSSIKDLSTKANSLEGFMFPDTYSVYSYTTAKDLIGASVKRFHEVWNQHLRDRCLSRKQLPLEMVTIASLIETEAKLPQERPIVSSVIYNRLRIGMNLSLDCTLVYASKLAGKWKNDGKVYLSDVNRESPYNTRKIKGLPPGPVGAPGLSSLLAALNPDSTNFIYYVREPSRNDGAHNFYADESGFEKGVNALRLWEKKRDARMQSAQKTGMQSGSKQIQKAKKVQQKLQKQKHHPK